MAWLGAYYATLVLVMVVFPRFVTTGFVLTLLPLFLVGTGFASGIRELCRRHAVTLLSLLLLPAWALVASGWAASRADGVIKALHLMAIVGALALSAMVIRRTPKALSGRIILGVVVGALVGLLYFDLQAATGQVITRWLLGWFPGLVPEKHLWIHNGTILAVGHAELNRSFAVLTLVFGPVLGGALLLQARAGSGTGHRWWTRLLTIALGAAMLAGAILTEHQSSQLGLLAGGIVLAIARLSSCWARRIVIAGWTTAVLLVVPFAVAAYKMDLHKSEAIPKSAQARVILWSYTAEQIAKRPWRGVGTNSTPYLNERRAPQSVERPADYIYPRRTGRHSHNIYMQVWYELGAIGALALLAFGLALLQVTRLMAPAMQPIALATFATLAGVAATSFSIWQPWFMSGMALSVLLLGLVAAAGAGTEIALAEPANADQ